MISSGQSKNGTTGKNLINLATRMIVMKLKLVPVGYKKILEKFNQVLAVVTMLKISKTPLNPM